MSAPDAERFESIFRAACWRTAARQVIEYSDEAARMGLDTRYSAMVEAIRSEAAGVEGFWPAFAPGGAARPLVLLAIERLQAVAHSAHHARQRSAAELADAACDVLASGGL